MRQLERKPHQRMTEQGAQVAQSTIELLVRELEATYSDQAPAPEYLRHVLEDLIARAPRSNVLRRRKAELCNDVPLEGTTPSARQAHMCHPGSRILMRPSDDNAS